MKASTKLRMHPAALAQVAALVRRPRGTVVLHGEPGVGKRTAALEIARQLGCEGCSDGSCHSCRMAASGNHPNIIMVAQDDKHKIGVEAVHELQHNLHYQQYERQGQRVVIIVEAESLTLPAQNALLKTLEEPPVGTLMLLTSQTPQALLPTVLSRCAMIYVPSLDGSAIEAFVREEYPSVDGARRAAIAAQSRGLIGRAAAYAADPQQLEADRQLAAEVERLLQAPDLFERLQLATAAAAEQARRSAFAGELALQARRAARGSATATTTTTAPLLALERLQQRLRANVNPKTAFEAFAVELAT